MVTYSDLIQTGILIIGLIDLVLRLIDADRNKRQRRKKRLSARGPAMVTYSDLIQTGILIIGLIDLVLRLIDADRNKRQSGS